jgi:hypothetical protein
MTKHEGMTKTDFIPGSWAEVYSNFDINSSFVIRISSFRAVEEVVNQTPLGSPQGAFAASQLNKLLNSKGWLSSRFLRNAIELMIVQTPIVTGFFEKLGVCADLLDAATVHHDDLIGG